ncbi:hypothetical protein AB0H18_25285 [Streptomyces sp. NPDC020766]|uniref:hypothetical protein n=1 Tax=Streptomyces sp. NPDC020766 TaxID=3155011 RepID=UPI0033F647FA
MDGFQVDRTVYERDLLQFGLASGCHGGGDDRPVSLAQERYGAAWGHEMRADVSDHAAGDSPQTQNVRVRVDADSLGE